METLPVQVTHTLVPDHASNSRKKNNEMDWKDQLLGKIKGLWRWGFPNISNFQLHKVNIGMVKEIIKTEWLQE